MTRLQLAHIGKITSSNDFGCLSNSRELRPSYTTPIFGVKIGKCPSKRKKSDNVNDQEETFMVATVVARNELSSLSRLLQFGRGYHSSPSEITVREVKKNTSLEGGIQASRS